MTRITVTQGAMDITVDMTATDCANCAIVFAVPTRFNKERREDGKAFYCPNGHNLVYGPSELEKLRRERDAARRNAEYADERANRIAGERDTAQRSLAATKGVVTRMRKRAIAGTCQFCRRHFENVERHVAARHPGEQP